MLFVEEDHTEKLIDAVEQRPLLYDKHDKEYSNVVLKKKIWEEVGQLLVGAETWGGMSDEMKREAARLAQRRWDSLRSCFTRELRLQRENKSLPGAKKRRTYLYFHQLMFLLPTVDSKDSTSTAEDYDEFYYETQPQKTVTSHEWSNKSHKSATSRETKSQKIVTNPETNNDVTDLVCFSVPKRKVANKVKNHDQSVVVNGSGERIGACGEDCHFLEKNITSTDCDEDHNFALSLVPMLRRLGEYDKLDVKLQILTLFKDKCLPPSVRNTHN